MAFKKINQFLRFDTDSFLADKKLMLVGFKEWRDYTDDRLLGSKLEIVIVEDKTDYGTTDGNTVNNLYEKLSVKIPAKLNNVPMNAIIRLINPKAVVYGEFRNQLSITAESIEIVGK